MAKQGISLHLGLNRVDPVHYGGWDGALTACEFDANDMRDLAKSRGFKPTVLLTPDATADAVQGAIWEAAKKLVAGDIFFFSYSGHGSQVPDGNKDEPDGQDETWVLFDRELVWMSFGRCGRSSKPGSGSWCCRTAATADRLPGPCRRGRGRIRVGCGWDG